MTETTETLNQQKDILKSKKATSSTVNGISKNLAEFCTMYEPSGSFHYPKHVFFTAVKKEKTGSQINFQVVKDEIIPCECPCANEAGESHHTKSTAMPNVPELKESYLDLLILAADELIEKGVTSTTEINSSQCEAKINIKQANTASYIEDESNNSSIHSNFHKKCENKICGAVVNKQSQILQAKIVSMKSSQSLWLCLQCYKAWKFGHYCYYCNLIYREFSPGAQAFIDSKTWIQCDYCQNWQHMQCEEAKGKYHDIIKLNQDKMFKYICPMCRKEDSDNASGKSPQKKRRNQNEFLNLKIGRSNKKKASEDNGKCKQTILNYDTRDIYHDFYKISNLANLNIEEKKTKPELNQ